MKHLLYLISIFITLNGFSQESPYFNYSNVIINLKSEALNDSIAINLHLPETHQYSSTNTKYPVIILFDSQHEKTYPHIINSIDMLTSESQIPESIIVGIPFKRYNRYYLTSDQKKENDSVMGIKRTEQFMFNELIPLLNSQHKANDFLTIVGHSRTAFLVNYLITSVPDKIDLAIAASSFYDNPPINLMGFKAFLKDTSNIKTPLKYYFSAGTSIDDKDYFNQCSDIVEFINKNPVSKKLTWSFIKTPSANHMINYWMSVPPILATAFDNYNDILSTWFETKLKDKSITNPIKEFKNNLKKASDDLGFQINPSLTQIYSLANAYANENNYNKALEFIQLGMSYYPNYGDLIETEEYYKEQIKTVANKSCKK